MTEAQVKKLTSVLSSIVTATEIPVMQDELLREIYELEDMLMADATEKEPKGLVRESMVVNTIFPTPSRLGDPRPLID